MGSFAREKFSIWIRLACTAIAVAALAYVFTRINLHQLALALRNARGGWLIAAIIVYGFVLLPSAWRWHLTLKLTGCAVSFAATMRMTLIGHLFYSIFFGAAGGDVAKAALYSRRYQMPMPEVLASTPLDRLLGMLGLLIFTAASFALAAWNGAFSRFGAAALKLPAAWIALIAVVGIFFVVWFFRKEWGSETAMGRLALAFIKGTKRLLKSPRIFWEGLMCGLIVQIAMAASLACGLEAVSHTTVAWGKLIWTLPVITVVSALPVNIAGLGLREGAVLALLGIYGVPPADAVAASLLTFVARVCWAMVGAAALWQRRTPVVIAKPAMG